jgi:ubiquinone/menaquinone biosynthesis C-methylase UbiE
MGNLNDSDLNGFYRSFCEKERLSKGHGLLEKLRTQEILRQRMPPPPGVVFDIGGAAGVHALWLAEMGYEVHLIDPMPLHIEQAKLASDKQPDHPIAECAVGDARKLQREDESVDIILMFGPLYHLTEMGDRIAAMKEAARILKRGGLLFGAGVSRFASTLDGIQSGFLDDPAFEKIVAQDLATGRHENPTGHPAWFTSTYFHHPSEMKGEVERAGLRHLETLGVEGPARMMGSLDELLRNTKSRARILKGLTLIESEPSLLGASAHLMVVAKK